jgi:Flp pilus assembly protein TadB
MCLPALPLAILAAGALGAGAAVYSSSKSASASKAANASNERIAADNAQRSEQQYNKANQKVPDIAAMVAANRDAMKSGMGATFLTGAGGIAPGAQTLGGNTLLGR